MKSASIYRINGVMLMFVLFSVILYFGKTFFIPLFFSIMLSMLLLPVANFLENRGMGRIGSTFVSMLIFLFFLFLIGWIIVAQGSSIADDWPEMSRNAQKLFQEFQQWLTMHYGIAVEQQTDYIDSGVDKMLRSGEALIGSWLSAALSFLAGLVMVLLYFFFLMWKREKYREFFLRLVMPENRNELRGELDEITTVAGRYLIGRLISMGFLAAFYMIGFSIFGLRNGLLVALVAVIPTIIPYIGAYVGALFPLAMALVSGDQGLVMPITIILIVAQIIDNNIIEPLVEGESLDISPIFTIVALVLGNMIWGIAGMILFVPLFAIIKIICDHIPALDAYSHLLNNEVSTPKWLAGIKKLWSSKK